MKKLLFALTAVAMMTACTENDEINSSVDYVVTGYNETDTDTRTAFGTPKSSTIPFMWSSGDYIWLGEAKSDAIESDCQIAQFVFSGGSPAIVGIGHVFYNMTASSNNAYVLATQTADGNLGNDGDFGYATLDAFGSFCLKHKTSYLWFNTTTDDADMPKLASITVDAGDVNIAGKQTYDYTNGEWSSNVTEGSSTITLNFAEGHALVAENEGVMAAMVCLPAAINGKTLTITYTFEDGSKYTETKNPTKDLVAGATSRISTKIAKSSLVKEPSYELRVLTFEDEDAKFTSYSLSYASLDVTTWSNLIASPEYMDPLIYDSSYMCSEEDRYAWYDENNTFLASEIPCNYYSYSYWGGGHAVSNYAASDFVTYGTYQNQLTVYGAEQEYGVTKTGGYNGSSNFVMHYGYDDNTPYNMTENLPYIYFKDGVARVIDHMYVNNSCYALTCFFEGNALTEGKTIQEGDYVKVVATGFLNGNETGKTSEFFLADGPNGIVTEWTKWDLTGLGKVDKVEFNILGSVLNKDGMSMPAYFAYDDVAVQFTE
ncbi:MAG: DUF4465 domain-containing protein [Bacteroides sp.]|nr:DUF4465 domain-containing protein [Bacteroides sp.]